MIKEVNIYGNRRFERSHANVYVERLSQSFKEFYLRAEYLEHQPAAITSGVDPTVRFLGSHISVLKPHLLNNTIPDTGYFLRQNCLRTQNAKKLIDENYCPKWGSYFPSLGAIAPPEHLDRVCQEVFLFFTQELMINKDHIKLRLNSKDKDLLHACRGVFPESSLEFDTRGDDYYIHCIGEEGVYGRNFNIALRDSGTEDYSDIGNVIILETDSNSIGVEVALGASTILKQLYSLKHVNDCYPFLCLSSADECLKRKFEDAVISSVVLWREGLRPKATGGRGRILRSYLRTLLYLSEKLNLSEIELRDSIRYFERNEFSESKNDSFNDVVEFVANYKTQLLKGDISSKEDETISKVLS